jgi:hypothetical protein
VLSDAVSASRRCSVIPGYDPRMFGGGALVPYVAAWTSEQVTPSEVIPFPGGGIGYADETVADRDRDGVLWSRISFSPGQGRPEYHRMHPLRQRHAMRRLLCQVCAQPADHTEQGHLWLLTDHRQDWPGWPDGVVNPFPPLCRDCAYWSVRLCPPLKRGYVAIRAQSRPSGVIGVRFHPEHWLGVRDETGDPVAYTDPMIRRVLATQLTRTLYDCRSLDLDRVTP